MPANVEASAMATGLETVNFPSSLKEGQCQIMFKLLHSCTQFTCCKVMLKTLQVWRFNTTWFKNFQMYKLSLEKAKETEIKLPTSIGSYKTQGNSKKTFTSVSLSILSKLCFDCVDQKKKMWKILKKMGIPDHFTCLLYAGQEAIVRTGYVTTDWLQIG